MTDPNEIIKYFKSFLEFCLKYPFLSIPVAFILIMGLVVHFLETVKKFVEFVIGVQKKGTAKRKALLWGSLGAMVMLSVASPFIAETFSRPKPVMQTKPGKVLAKDFVVAWEFKHDKNPVTGFEVTVSEKAEGRKKMYRSKTPYVRVAERGLIGVQVRAIGSNWRSDLSDEAVFEVYDDSVDRMRAKHEIVVAVHIDNSDGLFCFLNTETGDYDGFDVDVIKLLVARLKRKYALDELNVVTQHVTWPEIIDAPNAGEIDFSIASISITPERQKRILFSEPYWTTEIAMMQRKNSAKAAEERVTWPEVKGLRIGVHKGTTAVDFLNKVRQREPSLEIRELDNNPALFAWLQNDTISAIAYDYARTIAEAATRPSFVSRRFDKSFGVENEYYGIAFGVANEQLRDDVNQILGAERKTLDGLMTRRIQALYTRGL